MRFKGDSVSMELHLARAYYLDAKHCLPQATSRMEHIHLAELVCNNHRRSLEQKISSKGFEL